MNKRKLVPFTILLALSLILPTAEVRAKQTRGVPVNIGKRDITGVVANSRGFEAGVWVIAETTELPTKFVRIVVTDEEGRYLIPGSGVKSAISGLKRFQSGGPGEYRFCESFYHRRRSESEHGTILWAGQFARNEEQFVA